MSQSNDKWPTFEADEALAIHRLVKMDADGKITYADATDFPDGSVHSTVLAVGDDVAIRPVFDDGTRKLTANAAITAGAPIYAAADGKIAPSGSIPLGKALEAASADGDVVECLLLPVPYWIPAAAAETVNTATALSLATYRSNVVTGAGALAITLANGTRAGQRKFVQMTTDGGGTATLTPASLSGGTTIAFADVGDFADLLWNGAAWVPIALGNDADGTTAPVLA